MGPANQGLLRWSELCANLLRNGVGNLALQVQDVAAITVICLRPEMLIGVSLNELGGNTHPSTRTDDRSLDDGIYVQFASNFGQALLCAFSVRHDGGSCDYPQRADFSEVRDQLIRHAVREILLRWISRKILKRKNGNRPDRLFVPR